MFLIKYNTLPELTENDLLVTVVHTKEVATHDPETGEATILVPQENLEGFWVLTSDEGNPKQVAELDDTGHVVSTNDTVIIGCWLSPILGGWTNEALSMVDHEIELNDLKSRLKTEIDVLAEEERLKYITTGSGQVMEYQQAAAEANLLLTNKANDPNFMVYPAAWPMLAASVGIDGNTIEEVAMVVAGMHAQWQIVGSSIRAARLHSKKQVDDAPTKDAAQQAFDNLTWPNFGI